MERTKAATSSIMSEAIIEFLILSIPILGRLKDNELKIIEKYMNLIEVMPGEIVFKEGDSGNYVCFIVDGWLVCSKKQRLESALSYQHCQKEVQLAKWP